MREENYTKAREDYTKAREDARKMLKPGFVLILVFMIIFGRSSSGLPSSNQYFTAAPE